jgi:PAS domain S-box-containing protein
MKRTRKIPKHLDAQAYLAAIISSSDDGIISKDLTGNITSWNPAAERIFGYSAEEAIGRHISMLIPADLLSEEDYILGQVRDGKNVTHFETKRRRKNGTLIDISVTVSPIKNSKGKIVGASKIARDITELREADRVSAYLGAIVESSDDAIISKDLNGYITSWNKSAERIFGYTEDEVVGKHITLLIPSERASEEDSLLTTLKTGQRVDHFETVRRHKDGHEVFVSLTVSPIKDRNGNLIGASKVSRDITERLQSQEALKEVSRKKDEFIANMSHELRTPMNAVIGLTSILKKIDGMPDQASKFIDTLELSADNMMALINDLLDLAKIESGGFDIDNIEFSLAEEIAKAVSIINVKAQEKGLKLFVNFAPTADRQYIGDPLRIHQVIMNLLSNAVKFTEQGSIEVYVDGAKRKDNNVIDLTIKVEDTGIGIPTDKLESIFDKFTQADSSITRRYGGSGLGLSITHAIITKLGGTITVKSELGRGTSFLVEIPLKSYGSKVKDAGLEEKDVEIAASNRDVLLVEDYEPNIIVASTMLESLGFNYDIARNGHEALGAFSHGKYDVILMDVQMHDLDGLEATRRIRKIEENKGLNKTPIIAMTAHVRENDKAKCLEAGMDDFLPKPFDFALLAQKIQNYITK